MSWSRVLSFYSQEAQVRSQGVELVKISVRQLADSSSPIALFLTHTIHSTLTDTVMFATILYAIQTQVDTVHSASQH